MYAAYLAYTDHETGRVIRAIEDAGKLDNTLIIYITGDNGASPEGTLHGLYSEFALQWRAPSDRSMRTSKASNRSNNSALR